MQVRKKKLRRRVKSVETIRSDDFSKHEMYCIIFVCGIY